MGNLSKFVLGATALGAAVTGLSVPSDVSAADYYAGKTITVLIGRSP